MIDVSEKFELYVGNMMVTDQVAISINGQPVNLHYIRTAVKELEARRARQRTYWHKKQQKKKNKAYGYK